MVNVSVTAAPPAAGHRAERAERAERQRGGNLGTEQQRERAPVLLVVEDDATISDLLAYNLKRAGYEIVQEHTGRSGLETALGRNVDLVLMDLMLPGLDGIGASREIKRRKPHLPIIMLTARTDRSDLLEGFEAGADDYVTKPFDIEVLLARIAARLRGVGPADPPATQPASGSSFPWADIELDSDTRTLIRADHRLPLSPKEFELLSLLLSAPGHLFSREEITERVWKHRYITGSRTLDVHVRRLRKKLDEVGSSVGLHTVRGAGYRLVADPAGSRATTSDRAASE